MDKATAPRRRWFRYSLRTLFVAVTLFAVWLGWELKLVRERRAMRRWLLANDGAAGTSAEINQIEGVVTIPFWREWLGDTPAALVALSDASPREREEEAKRLFPEATVCRMVDLVPPTAPRPVMP